MATFGLSWHQVRQRFYKYNLSRDSFTYNEKKASQYYIDKSLLDHVPAVPSIISYLKTREEYKRLPEALHNKDHITVESILSYECLWQDVVDQLVALLLFYPANTKCQIARQRSRYGTAKQKMLQIFVDEHIISTRQRQKHKLRACLYLLGCDFITIFEKFISYGRHVKSTECWDWFDSPDTFLPEKKIHAKTLYCMSGYLLYAAKGEARRRSKRTQEELLEHMIDAASVEKDALEETRKEFPTGKVDRIMAFGGLYFSNRSVIKSFTTSLQELKRDLNHH
jgi:hypothetical protein